MTAQLPSRERLEQYANDPRMCNVNDEIRAMARALLAAHEQEPVAWACGKNLFFPYDCEGQAKHTAASRGDDCIPLYTHPAPVPAVPELVSIIGELTSAIRSINRAPHHIAKGVDDDEPCYWQRKEWIDWILELASSADEKSRAAMLNGGKS